MDSLCLVPSTLGEKGVRTKSMEALETSGKNTFRRNLQSLNGGADRIGHNGTTSTKGLVVSGRGIMRGLMFDFGIQLRTK